MTVSIKRQLHCPSLIINKSGHSLMRVLCPTLQKGSARAGDTWLYSDINPYPANQENMVS